MASNPNADFLCLRYRFFEHINSRDAPGVDCEGKPARFFPYTVLKEYWTLERIRELHQVSGITTPIHIIQAKWLRILSILLDICATVDGSLVYFDYLVAESNDDDSLPWKYIPRGLTQDSKGRAVFDAAHDVQWKYCPFLLFPPMSNKSLHRKAIMAFSQRDYLSDANEARDAVLHKAEVCQNAYGHLQEGQEAPKYVVLKTYSKDNQQYYSNENRAYAGLPLDPPNILKCFGSYRWVSENGDSHSTIILEYAHQGSLLHTFDKGRSPYSFDTIRNMWSGFIGLAKALEVVHHHYSLKAVHQDLKPSNILVFPNSKSHSAYAYTLKIADFGACRTPLVPSITTIPGTRASRTYTPPELHLNDTVRYSVDEGVDMWAMGCILIETAVWISFGEQGRQDFRDMRMKETAQLPDHKNDGRSDCFHDNERVLKCVEQVGEWIRTNGRQCDTITPLVVDLVLKHLLLEAGQRITSRILYNRLSVLIKDACPPGRLPETNLPMPFWRQDSTLTGKSTVQSSGKRSSEDWTGPLAADSSSLPISALRIKSPTLSSPQDGHFNEVTPSYQQHSAFKPLEVAAPAHMTRELPKMTIAEFEEWTKRRHPLEPRRSLPGQESLEQVKGRDFVFLVDNSRHMQCHVQEVSRLVAALAYLVKNLDPDGADFICTSNPNKKEKVKTRKAAKDFIHRNFGEGQQIDCNMEVALVSILQDMPKPPRRRLIGPKPKPLSVFVLTNGVWDDSRGGTSGAEAPIESCIKRMKEQGVARTHVAIQFLRFGSNPKGIQRLEYLDNDLPNKECNKDYDIVDHKPATFNLWDILIGSVSRGADASDVMG
ncbi:kinase-like domain-containing protein [Stachybotrys elegans]|uniref:Kinase-like domain-containing protein n=1 Tax=Stachybotrys elegans TaxID=80388 RepID=A0A8K0SGD7_9HYPO|nr:kinase-like domain-containing protein [Stachybotrys elegans]